MPKKINLIGQRFGRLSVREEIEPRIYKNGKRKRRFLCECDCGVTRPFCMEELRNGDATSCGCYVIEILKERSTTHGRTVGGKADSVYQAWGNIRTRCYNPNNSKYHRYGGRGIRVCQRWRNSFPAFLEDMGEKPSPKHSIDRLDNDGNYSCGKCEECLKYGWADNCAWKTQKEQMNNKASNVLIEHQGTTQTISQWSEETGIARHVIEDRVKRGFNSERVLAKRDLRPVLVEIFGQKRSMLEWSERFGVPKGTIHARISQRGWCRECAVTIPVKGGLCKHR